MRPQEAGSTRYEGARTKIGIQFTSPRATLFCDAPSHTRMGTTGDDETLIGFIICLDFDSVTPIK